MILPIEIMEGCRPVWGVVFEVLLAGAVQGSVVEMDLGLAWS